MLLYILSQVWNMIYPSIYLFIYLSVLSVVVSGNKHLAIDKQSSVLLHDELQLASVFLFTSERLSSADPIFCFFPPPQPKHKPLLDQPERSLPDSGLD